MRLGIDFGTTRTRVAAAIQGNYPGHIAGMPHIHGTGDTIARWDQCIVMACLPVNRHFVIFIGCNNESFYGQTH